MARQGCLIYTGRVELHNGWELRPCAYRRKDGRFVPELAARKHQSGAEGRVLTLDAICHSKEEAFQLALDTGLALAEGRAR
jgi:hypothetical protein